MMKFRGVEKFGISPVSYAGGRGFKSRLRYHTYIEEVKDMNTIIKKITGVTLGIGVLFLSACSSQASEELPEELAGGVTPHTDCVEATPEILAHIQEEIVDDNITLNNPQMIVDGNDYYVGASVKNNDELVSPSEVWQVNRAGQVYSISQGAVEYTGLRKSPTAMMLEEYPSGVDRCAIAESGYN